MKVAFFVGPKSIDLISSMTKSADNVEFFTYEGIEDLIRESTLRHIFFDRIVFSEKVLLNAEEELIMLDNYVKEYSGNTSIVLLCREDNEVTSIFSRVFNAPIYTPVILQKVTAKLLLELIKEDISAIRSKYYKVEEDQVKTVTNKSAEVAESQPVKQQEEIVEKKGFLNRLFGKKENKSQKSQTKNVSKEGLNTVGNTQNVVPNNGVESGIGDTSQGVGNTVESPSLENSSISEAREKSTFVSYGSGYSQVDDNGDGNVGNFDDSLDLSLGDLGEQHVDTGYLDDVDEEEILRSLSVAEVIEEVIEEPVKNTEVVEVESETVIEEVYEVEHKPTIKPVVAPVKVAEVRKYADTINESLLTNSMIVTGTRSSNSYAYTLRLAEHFARKGSKVVVLDLDTIENSVLSEVNLEKFYAEDMYCGIDDGKFFNNGLYSVVSNGYGVPVSKDSVLGILTKCSRYDVILIDCPLDCFNLIDNRDVLGKFKSLVYVKGNSSCLISTLKALSMVKEDISLFSNSDVVIDETDDKFSSIIQRCKETVLFSGVDWLFKF